MGFGLAKVGKPPVGLGALKLPLPGARGVEAVSRLAEGLWIPPPTEGCDWSTPCVPLPKGDCHHCDADVDWSDAVAVALFESLMRKKGLKKIRN